jgi:hypothetical protein
VFRRHYWSTASAAPLLVDMEFRRYAAPHETTPAAHQLPSVQIFRGFREAQLSERCYSGSSKPNFLARANWEFDNASLAWPANHS